MNKIVKIKKRSRVIVAIIVTFVIIVATGCSVMVESNPRLIQGVEGFYYIIAIDTNTASFSSSIALDANGNVWTWGLNNNAILGHQAPHPNFPYRSRESRPRRIEGVHEFENLISVSVGNSHAMALDNIGRVWSWGSSSYSTGH